MKIQERAEARAEAEAILSMKIKERPEAQAEAEAITIILSMRTKEK